MVFEASGVLMSLGLGSLLSVQQPDFHEMCDLPLFVSGILHEASIEVDEGGTLAAAATETELAASGPLPLP